MSSILQRSSKICQKLRKLTHIFKGLVWRFLSRKWRSWSILAFVFHSFATESWVVLGSTYINFEHCWGWRLLLAWLTQTFIQNSAPKNALLCFNPLTAIKTPLLVCWRFATRWHWLGFETTWVTISVSRSRRVALNTVLHYDRVWIHLLLNVKLSLDFLCELLRCIGKVYRISLTFPIQLLYWRFLLFLGRNCAFARSLTRLALVRNQFGKSLVSLFQLYKVLKIFFICLVFNQECPFLSHSQLLKRFIELFLSYDQLLLQI